MLIGKAIYINLNILICFTLYKCIEVDQYVPVFEKMWIFEKKKHKSCTVCEA